MALMVLCYVWLCLVVQVVLCAQQNAAGRRPTSVMAAKIFGVAIPTAIGGILFERGVLTKLLPTLFEASTVAGLPKAFGLTLGALTASGFWLTLYGFSVGAARNKYMELAKKDGEKDCEERYSLPNLYVDGNTKNSKAFNCVQRSHQQAFETLPQLYAFTLTAGLCFPVTAAAVDASAAAVDLDA